MITGTDQILQQYVWNLQYPDIEELRRSLHYLSDDESMLLLNKYESLLRRAAWRDHHEIISTILSSLTQHRRLEALSLCNKLGRAPLHQAAWRGKAGSVKTILSPLTQEQQMKLLSMRDNDGYTPADCASPSGDEETKRVLREYEQKCM